MREVDLELDFAPNVRQRKHRIHSRYRSTAFITHLQRSCNVQDAEHTMLHRPDSE